LQSILALEVRSTGGRTICSIGTPGAELPEWMIVQENLESPTGETWIMEYRPTAAYFEFDRSQSSQFFFWAGILLSAALGALAFQFLRLREFSKALAGANRELDYRLRELSRADERLRESNIQLEHNVQQRTAQLNEAVDEISAFGHSISHDLRSPLGAIMNFTAVLEEDYGERLDDEGVRILGRIRNSGETATYLLDRLVQYLWVGRKEPDRTRLDMNEVARAAWAEARSGDAASDGVEFDIGMLPPAHGDPELLHRVFVNLFGNALKYTRNRKERHVEVAGCQEDGWCTYSVADDGVGFRPEEGEHIFEPFRRLHGSKSFEGSGLGLAITAKIVRRHGGKVWAESDGIRGARFFFTLPCAESETA
jgi:signal transduction histidine kinase